MNGPWKQVASGVAASAVIVGAAIVWGQTTERIDTVEDRQAIIERMIDEIRRTQQDQSASLSALDERSVRILDAIKRLDGRIERMVPKRQ